MFWAVTLSSASRILRAKGCPLVGGAKGEVNPAPVASQCGEPLRAGYQRTWLQEKEATGMLGSGSTRHAGYFRLRLERNDLVKSLFLFGLAAGSVGACTCSAARRSGCRVRIGGGAILEFVDLSRRLHGRARLIGLRSVNFQFVRIGLCSRLQFPAGYSGSRPCRRGPRIRRRSRPRSIFARRRGTALHGFDRDRVVVSNG